MALWAIAAVAIAVLLGIAAFVGTIVGRHVSERSQAHSPQSRQPSERFVEEVQDCVELGDCVSRDLEIVSSLLADDSPAIPPELMNAMQQLLKTSKALSGKLQRVDNTGSLNRGTLSAFEAPRGKSALPETQRSKPAEKPSFAAPQTTALADDDDQPANDQDGEECRRFPRSPCHGSLQATIYPPPSNPTGEPIRCAVLTRNLSCGGVGIAHSEKLYPKQVLVLEAVGRLLVAEVRWCRQLDDRFFIVGCRLIKTGE